MKSTLLASELRKVGYSECLAFDNFLMFLDSAKISSVLSALPLPLPLTTSSFLTALAVGSSSLIIQLISSRSIEVSGPAILSKLGWCVDWNFLSALPPLLPPQQPYCYQPQALLGPIP